MWLTEEQTDVQYYPKDLYNGIPLVIPVPFGSKKIHLEKFFSNDEDIRLCNILCDKKTLQYGTANVPNQFTLFPNGIWGEIATVDLTSPNVTIELQLLYPQNQEEKHGSLKTVIFYRFS